MFGWLRKSKARKFRSRTSHAVPARVRASYDATATPGDDRYWINADNLSADAANSKTVRQVLRNRSRYEVANGGYANGMVKALAVDQISTGPRLQMLTGNTSANNELEKEWIRWSKAVKFARTLRTMVKTRVRDGESFAILTHNSKLRTYSQLQLRLIEAEQVTTPLTRLDTTQNQVDGIDFDDDGNPIRYWILPHHPGGTGGLQNEPTPLSAEVVIHWFTEDRPGQHRGIPDFTPSLRLFANHRRYLRAVIRAAETAAEISAVIKTNLSAGELGDAPEPLDTFELEPGAVTVLPDEYDLAQLRAEQPTTTFTQFNEAIVTEEARPLLMPRNVATGDSSSYNYSSGRLDNQIYDGSNDVDRDDIELIIVERVFEQWLTETLSSMSGIAISDIDLTQYDHAWFWKHRGHVDPQKESKAQETKLANNTTTLADEYALQNKDWEKQLRQRAKEKALMNELGITPAAPIEDTEDEEVEVDDETSQATRD